MLRCKQYRNSGKPLFEDRNELVLDFSEQSVMVTSPTPFTSNHFLFLPCSYMLFWELIPFIFCVLWCAVEIITIRPYLIYQTAYTYFEGSPHECVTGYMTNSTIQHVMTLQLTELAVSLLCCLRQIIKVWLPQMPLPPPCSRCWRRCRSNHGPTKRYYRSSRANV